MILEDAHSSCSESVLNLNQRQHCGIPRSTMSRSGSTPLFEKRSSDNHLLEEPPIFAQMLFKIRVYPAVWSEVLLPLVKESWANQRLDLTSIHLWIERDTHIVPW
jgi:hypothetical protein